MVDPNDVSSFVRGLFDAAGVKPSEEEMATFVAMYPMLRAALDALPSVPDDEP